MGNSEDVKSCKRDKSSSPTPDQSNVHVYPDWAAMQAYYGPRVAVPTYFNSPIAPGHTHHPYMWGPQPMMPPYGTPYAAMYAHGGVYAHPGIPLGAHPPGHGTTTSPAVCQAMDGTSLSLDASAKSSMNSDRGFVSKLKEFEGLAISLGNGTADNVEGGTDHGHSQSGETEGSTDGSQTNTAGVCEPSKKRSRESTPNNSSDGKSHARRYQPRGEVNDDSEKAVVAVSPAKVAGKVMGTILSPNMETTLELKNEANTHPTDVSQLSPALPNEPWLQNEREMKREKRKQSNRESARRSRLRKQAEAEELAVRVQSLTAENLTIKSEINKLMENSDKLKLENASLMERLKNEELGLTEEVCLGKIDDKRPVGTANLLARVNNSGSLDRTNEDNEAYESSSSGTKLHQLLDSSPRTDAVAAG